MKMEVTKQPNQVSKKVFQWGMRLLLFTGLVMLVGVMAFTSPYKSQDINQINFLHTSLFYVSLFIFHTGLFTLVLFWLRRKASDDDLISAHMGVSLRQGLLLAIIVVAIFILQSFRVLTWWDGLITVGAVLMIELYFLAR